MIWGGEWDGMGGKGTFRGVGGGIGDGKCGNLGREIGEWEEKFGDTHPPTSSIFEDIPPPSRPLPLVLPPPPPHRLLFGVAVQVEAQQRLVDLQRQCQRHQPPRLDLVLPQVQAQQPGAFGDEFGHRHRPYGGGGGHRRDLVDGHFVGCPKKEEAARDVGLRDDGHGDIGVTGGMDVVFVGSPRRDHSRDPGDEVVMVTLGSPAGPRGCLSVGSIRGDDAQHDPPKG